MVRQTSRGDHHLLFTPFVQLSLFCFRLFEVRQEHESFHPTWIGESRWSIHRTAYGCCSELRTYSWADHRCNLFVISCNFFCTRSVSGIQSLEQPFSVWQCLRKHYGQNIFSLPRVQFHCVALFSSSRSMMSIVTDLTSTIVRS